MVQRHPSGAEVGAQVLDMYACTSKRSSDIREVTHHSLLAAD